MKGIIKAKEPQEELLYDTKMIVSKQARLELFLSSSIKDKTLKLLIFNSDSLWNSNTKESRTRWGISYNYTISPLGSLMWPDWTE